MSSSAFWKPFERVVCDYDELAGAINDVFSGKDSKTFAWRGQVDAGWPLYSSLYRRLNWTVDAAPPQEEDLSEAEGKILADLHRWGLHMQVGLGRLSILNQLAVLQHYGAPTRLIDVTFNPWIAAWFAVEEKEDRYEECDGRLFALDVTNRLINENSKFRDWEDEIWRPWSKSSKSKVKDPIALPDWCTSTFAWRPPHFDRRVAAQNGGFVFGGVPMTSNSEGKPLQWRKVPGGRHCWLIEEVRAFTSVALRPHRLHSQRGKRSTYPMYTIRIEAAAKNSIRTRLERLYGYQHRTIYPDLSGFASFGTPGLRASPPKKPGSLPGGASSA
jgi:hypothetical protein